MKKKIYNFICCVVIATISVYTDYAKGDVVVANNKECRIDFFDFEKIARYSNNLFLNNSRLPEKLVFKKYKKEKYYSFASYFTDIKNIAQMPGFAAFFEKNSPITKLYLGVKRQERPVPTNLENGIFNTDTNDNSHTERQLISQCIADNKICSDTKGTICVFTRAHPCVNIGNPENGNICCVDYYEQLAQLYKNINFHIYFYVGDVPRNITFHNTYFQNNGNKIIQAISAVVQLIDSGAQINSLQINDNNNTRQLIVNNGILAVLGRQGWELNNNINNNLRTNLISHFVCTIENFLTNQASAEQISSFFNSVWGEQSHIKYHAIKTQTNLCY